MSERIVVALHSTVTGPAQFYLLEPGSHPSAGMPLQLLDADAILEKAELEGARVAADQMENFGTVLFNYLKEHPAFNDSVVPRLQLNSGHGDPFYVYFENRMQAFEELPWEALFAPDVGFLSQNSDFGIARMLKSASTKSEWLFEPPLRIVAVLGAGGAVGEKLDGVAQWEKLRDAVGQSGLPVQARILTCEVLLREQINGAEPSWATAELIQNRDQLFDEIRSFAPQMVHFFCHGMAATKPQLQVASFKDWETDAAGSILIEGEQLRQNADPDGNIWLVTLNCCETAMSGKSRSNSLSMPIASNLVSSGIPAVVGMRERIDGKFAQKFCGLFYQSLLSELRRRVALVTANNATDIHWACGLFRVRQSMYQEPDFRPAWTVPVLHTRLAPFQIRLHPAHASPNTLPGGPAAQPSDKPVLSAKDIHELGQELMQLNEDRKTFAQLGPVVTAIGVRIDEIYASLGVIRQY